MKPPARTTVINNEDNNDDQQRPHRGTDTCHKHMSSSLNSLRGFIYRVIWGTITGIIEGDTRSLDLGV